MSTLYEIPVVTLAGKKSTLAPYQGKVLLIVNTASECGYTPQYKGLQELHGEFHAQGLEVLGFPSNDYGAQEPGSDREIQTFCEMKFNVTFPMYSKGPVKGELKQPLYAYLTQNAPTKGEVAWNFEKFLVGRDGTVVGRFSSKVEPTSAELKASIQKALAAKS